jgi:hypothetical protein
MDIPTDFFLCFHLGKDNIVVSNTLKFRNTKKQLSIEHFTLAIAKDQATYVYISVCLHTYTGTVYIIVFIIVFIFLRIHLTSESSLGGRSFSMLIFEIN